ncbi:bacterial trigger factor protein-domain-containing protein, partial [Baffinella frigidus]
MFVRRTAGASLLAALAALSAPDAVAAFAGSAMPAHATGGAALCRVSPATSAFTPALRSPLVQPTLRSVVRRAAVAPRMAVEVVVKDLPGSQKQLTISVSADECENAYKAVLQRLQKGAEIPGFRKGKAPTAMVLNHFGKESVSAEACEKIIGAAVPMALQMKDIRAIGQAQMADEAAVAKMLEKFKPGLGVDFE